MQENPDDVTIEDNKAAGRFEAKVGDQLAIAEYRRDGDTIAFTHTEVPKALAGQGIASRLASVALDQAREQGLAVIPYCSFFASYIRHHPEYAALVPEEHRSLVSRRRAATGSA